MKLSALQHIPSYIHKYVHTYVHIYRVEQVHSVSSKIFELNEVRFINIRLKIQCNVTREKKWKNYDKMQLLIQYRYLFNALKTIVAAKMLKTLRFPTNWKYCIINEVKWTKSDPLIHSYCDFFPCFRP